MMRVIIIVFVSLNLFGCAVLAQKQNIQSKTSLSGQIILDMQEKLKADPDNAGYLLSLGFAYNECALYKEALLPLNKLVKMQPKRTDIHLALGAAYLGLRRFNQAEKEFKEAINISPDNVEGYIGLARVYYQNKDEANYQRQLDAIHKIDPRRIAEFQGDIN